MVKPEILKILALNSQIYLIVAPFRMICSAIGVQIIPEAYALGLEVMARSADDSIRGRIDIALSVNFGIGFEQEQLMI